MKRPRIASKPTLGKQLYPVSSARQETSLARGRYDKGMSLPEFKIWMVAASQDSLELKTTAPILCSMANIDGYGARKYAAVQECLTGLLKHEVHFLKADTEKGVFKFIGFSLFSYAAYEEGGTVTIKINSELAPYLHNLRKNFTQVNLEELLSLDSFYQARLYMLACSCSKLNYEGARTFSIQDFALALGMEYKKSDEWVVMRRARLCWEELQKKTDLHFSLVTLKTGRKISGVRFDNFKFLAKADTSPV